MAKKKFEITFIDDVRFTALSQLFDRKVDKKRWHFFPFLRRGELLWISLYKNPSENYYLGCYEGKNPVGCVLAAYSPQKRVLILKEAIVSATKERQGIATMLCYTAGLLLEHRLPSGSGTLYVGGIESAWTLVQMLRKFGVSGKLRQNSRKYQKLKKKIFTKYQDKFLLPSEEEINQEILSVKPIGPV
ncbi:MAG: hypothetical protein ABIF92_01785 [archaeon]